MRRHDAVTTSTGDEGRGMRIGVRIVVDSGEDSGRTEAGTNDTTAR